MTLAIDHIAIAVKDLESAAAKYSKALDSEVTYETIESEGVRVAIMHLENGRIELISPTGTEGSIAAFLEKNGDGLHHIALRTNDINAEVSRMETCGLQFLGKVRDGSEGTKITFIHPKSLNRVLVELCSTGK